MLELRPTCEHCNRPLPPASLEARICSFECTFCAACVDGVLGNLAPRPIRPEQGRKGENHLGRYPAATQVRHRPVDVKAHAAFVVALAGIPPERR